MQKRQTATREEIKVALIDLLQEKTFEQISVSDITKKAKINRGTFYLHYVDKFDLVDKLVTEVFDMISERLDAVNILNPLDTMVEIFDDLRQNFNFIQALSKNRFDYVNQMLREFLLVLIEKFEPLKDRLANQSHLPLDYATEVFLYSNAGIIFHWIEKGGIESSQEIAKMFIANNF